MYFRWFRFLCKRSDGFFFDEGQYFIIDVYEKLHNNLEELILEEAEFIGHKNVREKLKKIYLKKSSKKRKRNLNPNLRRVRQKNHHLKSTDAIPINGIGFGTFNQLSDIIQEKRKQCLGQNLDFITMNGVV